MPRSVMGFFPSFPAANEVADRLRAQGFTEMQVDQVHRYPGDGTERLQNPSQGRFGSLANLSLGAAVDPAGNAGPLMAADPSASGLSNPGEFPGRYGFMLAVLVDSDDQAEQVAREIEGAGGLV